jgi:hypothetical protein
LKSINEYNEISRQPLIKSTIKFKSWDNSRKAEKIVYAIGKQKHLRRGISVQLTRRKEFQKSQ